MSPRCAMATSRLVGSPTIAASISPDRRDGLAHGGVLGLLAEAEDHEQAAGVEPARARDVAGGAHHRRDRGLGVSRSAAVETTVLDHRG